MSFVLDACAMIAFLRGESGADVVESLILDEDCMIHAVNLCEVYYDCLLREEEENLARAIIADIESLGIVSRADMDTQFWQDVGLHKAKIRRASLQTPLADCFAMSLAKREDATLVTSDHHEFDPIIASELCSCSVMFIR
jgi:PIN domain nuclease of toxin-antitoxin system